MSSDGGGQDVDEQLYEALHKRLLKSGEWLRISSAMKRELDESGWTDDVSDYAKEKARSGALSFAELQQHVTPYAHDVLPAYVRQEILALINEFLDANLRT